MRAYDGLRSHYTGASRSAAATCTLTSRIVAGIKPVSNMLRDAAVICTLAGCFNFRT